MSDFTNKLWDRYMEITEQMSETFVSELPEYALSTPDYRDLCKQDSHYLFVYGTEKTNFRNSRRLIGSPLVAVGLTKAHYQMFIEPTAVGSNAMIMYTKQIDAPMAPVYGEIYQVSPSVIREFDWNENNNCETQRVRIWVNAVVDASGTTRQVMAYTYIHKASYWMSRLDRLRSIPTMKPVEGQPYFNFIRPHQNIMANYKEEEEAA